MLLLTLLLALLVLVLLDVAPLESLLAVELSASALVPVAALLECALDALVPFVLVVAVLVAVLAV